MLLTWRCEMRRFILYPNLAKILPIENSILQATALFQYRLGQIDNLYHSLPEWREELMEDISYPLTVEGYGKG
jgi:hypothetical protein